MDFSRFRMAFPVVVTLHTTDGERLLARPDVPIGAPGQAGRIDAAYAKLRREAGAVLGSERTGRVEEAIRSFEQGSIAEFFARLG